METLPNVSKEYLRELLIQENRNVAAVAARLQVSPGEVHQAIVDYKLRCTQFDARERERVAGFLWQGMDVAEIASHTGMPRPTIYTIIKKFDLPKPPKRPKPEESGITLTPPAEPVDEPVAVTRCPEVIEQERRMAAMIAEGKSVADIARALGMRWQAARKAIIQAGLDLPTDGRKLKKERLKGLYETSKHKRLLAETAIRLYGMKRLNVHEICFALGINYGKLYQILTKAGAYQPRPYRKCDKAAPVEANP